jgi:hypothetical protein
MIHSNDDTNSFMTPCLQSVCSLSSLFVIFQFEVLGCSADFFLDLLPAGENGQTPPKTRSKSIILHHW